MKVPRVTPKSEKPKTPAPEEAEVKLPPTPPATEAKTATKKGGWGRAFKFLLAFAFLVGAGVAYMTNQSLLEQGYILSLFGVYLPVILAGLGFICFLWALAGRRKPASKPTTAGETGNPAATEERELTIIRPCNFSDCPMYFRFEGAGKCGSDGVRPKYCKLSPEAFKELFSPDAHLVH